MFSVVHQSLIAVLFGAEKLSQLQVVLSQLVSQNIDVVSDLFGRILRVRVHVQAASSQRQICLMIGTLGNFNLSKVTKNNVRKIQKRKKPLTVLLAVSLLFQNNIIKFIIQ